MSPRLTFCFLELVHRFTLILIAIPLFAEPRFGLPQRRYSVRAEINVQVPMRDGVKLATDLYFPEGAGEKLLAITTHALQSQAPHGGAAHVRRPGLRSRGPGCTGEIRFPGLLTVSANDTNDGSNMLHWMAAQVWFTGKIGPYGCS